MKIKLFGKFIDNRPHLVLFDDDTSVFNVCECDISEFGDHKCVMDRRKSFNDFIINYIYPYPVCRIETMKNIIRRNIVDGGCLSTVQNAVYGTFPKEVVAFIYDNELNSIVREPSVRLYKENGNTKTGVFDFIEVDFPTVNDIDMTDDDRRNMLERLKVDVVNNKDKLIRCALLKIKEELNKRKYNERLLHFLKVDTIVMTCIGHLVLTFSFKNTKSKYV